jgi:MFS family permease
MTSYKTIFSIAGIMALRMIGLFMVMPLLALYVTTLSGAKPLLIGISLGIYGLTQASFQIPFGIISDFCGRKIIIFIGLLLFVVGSLIAALAHSIFMLIIGRALQGAGAVGSTLMALLSDVTDEAHRSQSMAIVGGSIGVSFSLAIVLGPVLNAWFNVPNLFLLSAAMGLIAIGMLLTTTYPLKKSPLVSLKFSFSSVMQGFHQIKDQKTLHYNLSSMLLHMILIMNFMGVPALLHAHKLLAQQEQWWIYLPILILSFLIALGWIMLTQKKSVLGFSMLLSVGLIIASQVTLIAFSSHLLGVSLGLLLFFIGFNFLEATLPSEISKRAAAAHRGMAMGLYSTTQFMGIFLGGLLGGIVNSYLPIYGVFILGTIVATAWYALLSLSTAKSLSLSLR